MTIDTNRLVSISDANQNFSKVTKLVDQFGSAVILKNNVPRYVVVEFKQADAMEAATNEELLAVSEKLMKKNKRVYEVLAK